MQPDLNNIKEYFKKVNDYEDLLKLPCKEVFDDEICNLLNELSKAIRNDKEAKMYPDIVTFGFFCREANIKQLKQLYYKENHIGRGISFHIAPSNVPINFAYSFVAGLLAGTPSIVRASTKDFVQTKIICRLLDGIQGLSEAKKYVTIISYNRDKEITDYFSSFCSVRVVWGGDATIREIRRSDISPRSVELTFSNRYSFCVINAESILCLNEFENLMRSFYNDTYLYDQNACSSPRLIYWLGKQEDVSKAKDIFWKQLDEYMKNRYKVEEVVAVDKQMTACRLAIEMNDIHIEPMPNNVIQRIDLKCLTDNIEQYACPGGSFLEFGSKDMDDLVHVVTAKYQTLTYFGLDARWIKNWVISNGLMGIDRIVPMGKASDFSLTWDGYDLIKSMSREILYS